MKKIWFNAIMNIKQISYVNLCDISGKIKY